MLTFSTTVLVDTRKVSRDKPESEYTDQEIIAFMKEGNQRAYEILIERYNHQLFIYLLNILNKNEQDAQDALGEAWSNVHKKINQYDPAQSFKNWVYRICHNVAIDLIRKNVSQKAKSIDVFNEAKFSHTPDFDKPKMEDIQKILKELSTKDQNIINLYYIEEKTIDEISKNLDIPNNVVSVRINRAKNKAKKIAEQKGY